MSARPAAGAQIGAVAFSGCGAPDNTASISAAARGRAFVAQVIERGGPLHMSVGEHSTCRPARWCGDLGTAIEDASRPTHAGLRLPPCRLRFARSGLPRAPHETALVSLTARAVVLHVLARCCTPPSPVALRLGCSKAYGPRSWPRFPSPVLQPGVTERCARSVGAHSRAPLPTHDRAGVGDVASRAARE